MHTHYINLLFATKAASLTVSAILQCAVYQLVCSCVLYICSFDPASASFTLESVVALRLDQHCDLISQLSVNATKELAIETSLAGIAATWEALFLDLAEYKGTYKLRSTEDVFAALEDNSVTLSTMKASKYYLVFEKQVTYWENTLALVSETVEIILQVTYDPGTALLLLASFDAGCTCSILGTCSSP